MYWKWLKVVFGGKGGGGKNFVDAKTVCWGPGGNHDVG